MVHTIERGESFMARIVTIACMAAVVLMVMGSFQFVAPRDGLIMFGGQAFAADMPTKAPVAPLPAPIGKGKGKAPYGKGKAPIVTRG
jgi:hypothetical protein